MERWLFLHLKHHHGKKELRDIMVNCCSKASDDKEMTLLAYYLAAVREKERQHMPLIGPCVDRRSLAMVHKLSRSDHIHGLICFACAQIYTHVSSWDRMWHETTEFHTDSYGRHDVCEIQWYKVKDSIFRLLAPHIPDLPNLSREEQAAYAAKKKQAALNVYTRTFLLSEFVHRFANEDYGTHLPWHGATEIAAGDTEWQRTLIVQGSAFGQVLTPRRDRIICCPEDVRSCCHSGPVRSKRPAHGSDEICGQCEIPLCRHCIESMKGVPCVMPMVLCNDNLWGYTTDIISKYQVCWLEAAIVSPTWTSMMMFFVEGDGGHLFGEVLNAQRYRVKVRGSCVSYLMPWEDIIRELRENYLDANLLNIPRKQECLWYMLRVHLNVAGQNLHKYIKQLRVRPYVLLLLLDFLIDRQHEIFRGKGSPAELKQLMRKVVAAEYPEREGHLPPRDRQGEVPASIASKIREMEEAKRKAEMEGQSWCSKKHLFREKNATPGDAATCVSRCVDEIRPIAMCVDRNNTSTCTPADAREGSMSLFGHTHAQADAREGSMTQCGHIHAQTGSRFRSQWCPQYFSEALPFVIPRMVSGPDFRDEATPWRRQ